MTATAFDLVALWLGIGWASCAIAVRECFRAPGRIVGEALTVSFVAGAILGPLGVPLAIISCSRWGR